MSVISFIAIRYLLGRAHEGGRYLRGAVTGIALSLVPIIITLIVADGMIRGITERYLELGTGHLQIYPYMGVSLEHSESLIKPLAGVRGVWRERHSMGVVVGPKSKVGASVRAITPSFWEDPGSSHYLVTVEGSSTLESNREMLLGESLAQTIGVHAGDTVRLMTIHVNAEGKNVPRLNPFVVKGIISSGYRELDALWCIIDFEAGMELLYERMSSTYLMVKITDPYTNADSTSELFYEVLGPEYDIYTWKELQRSQYNSYESTRQLLLFIMALIVMVAAVSVASATSMLAIERRRELAVLKATGMSPRHTEYIFLWAAFFTGLIGALFGIGVGLLLGCSINTIIAVLETVINVFSTLFHGEPIKLLDPGFYLEVIPIIIDWNAVLLIGIFTVLCSVAASWIPAHRAGTLKPVEILRKY
ncbi:ABC transporter permease [Pillotina sp. SPG140]